MLKSHLKLGFWKTWMKMWTFIGPRKIQNLMQKGWVGYYYSEQIKNCGEIDQRK
jgi:predicted DNA-binding transcriptional regulator